MVLSLGPVALGEGGQFEMKFVPTRGLSTGQTFRIDLEQRVDGVVTGGMTYVVVVGGGRGAARAA
jgi:hypothetical protein